MEEGQFDGVIFMGSTVSDSCAVYNALLPPDLVGRGGNVEHMRSALTFGGPPTGRVLGHRGGAYGPACGPEDDESRRRQPTALQAHELFWMTDRTPHESLPLDRPAFRQYFRLVAGPIGVWYAAHSTPNPLGTPPDAPVVTYDKFTGNEPAAAIHHAFTTAHFASEPPPAAFDAEAPPMLAATLPTSPPRAADLGRDGEADAFNAHSFWRVPPPPLPSSDGEEAADEDARRRAAAALDVDEREAAEESSAEELDAMWSAFRDRATEDTSAHLHPELDPVNL